VAYISNCLSFSSTGAYYTSNIGSHLKFIDAIIRTSEEQMSTDETTALTIKSTNDVVNLAEGTFIHAMFDSLLTLIDEVTDNTVEISRLLVLVENISFTNYAGDDTMIIISENFLYNYL